MKRKNSKSIKLQVGGNGLNLLHAVLVIRENGSYTDFLNALAGKGMPKK